MFYAFMISQIKFSVLFKNVKCKEIMSKNYSIRVKTKKILINSFMGYGVWNHKYRL